MSVTPLKRYTQAELKRLAGIKVKQAVEEIDGIHCPFAGCLTPDEFDHIQSVVNSLANALVKIQDRIHEGGVPR